VAVHLEMSPKGEAMLGLLRHLEKGVQARSEALGMRTTNLLTVG
jgi:hypothetical protein